MAGCSAIDGWQQVDRVLEVDQTPIGKTPRSCPATYVGFWDAIRRLFADTLEARRAAGQRASASTPARAAAGLRGPGHAHHRDELPARRSKVPCDVCHGQHFNAETLAVSWRSKNIGEVLTMEVDEGGGLLRLDAGHQPPLQLLRDVGLGCLTLGQPSPTLSGGGRNASSSSPNSVKVRDDVTRRGNKAPHTLYVLGRTDRGPAHGRRGES